jgi:hypothetical protein
MAKSTDEPLRFDRLRLSFRIRGGFRALVRDPAEHLRAHRQNERESVVMLNPPDWNADQFTLLVKHAAT